MLKWLKQLDEILRGDATRISSLETGKIKIPMLFFLTLAITFPSLYVFNALVG